MSGWLILLSSMIIHIVLDHLSIYLAIRLSAWTYHCIYLDKMVESTFVVTSWLHKSTSNHICAALATVLKACSRPIIVLWITFAILHHSGSVLPVWEILRRLVINSLLALFFHFSAIVEEGLSRSQDHRIVIKLSLLEIDFSPWCITLDERELFWDIFIYLHIVGLGVCSLSFYSV